MKKYAWTLAELMMALIFIMVISGFLISNFKPASQNAKISIYAVIRNLERGIIAIDDKYEKIAQDCTTGITNADECKEEETKLRTIFYPNPHDDVNQDTNNSKFCKELANVMNLEKYDCNKTGTDPNFVLGNGVEIFGLNSVPVTFQKDDTLEARRYSYLNIGVDINGKAKGPNKVGVDRFPLRIYAVDNIVTPVNCAETEIYNWRRDGIKFTGPTFSGNDSGIRTTSDVAMTGTLKNPYCKTGNYFGATAGVSYSNVNFLTNNELITYDTFYNAIEPEDQNGGKEGQIAKKDTLVEGSYGKSFAETVCGVYNRVESGRNMNRFLSSTQCANAGFNIYSDCNKTDKDRICYYLLHRPSAALSAVVNGMVGSDLDMD